MPNQLVVGLAEVKWSVVQEDVLVAFSLGSCVGVALWDPVLRAGALAHVVLPSAKGRAWQDGPGPSREPPRPEKPGKYAATAVSYAARCLTLIGGDPARMRVWWQEGSRASSHLPGGDIGANVRAVKEALKRGFLHQGGCGQSYGRTELYVGEGKVTVYSVSRGEREI